MDPSVLRDITRRHFFKQSGFGIGGPALSALLRAKLFAAQDAGPLASRAPHFPAKARHIIYLFMAGAPTQIDLFDHKPALQAHNGEEIPSEFIPKGERFAFIKGTPRLLGSPFTFKKYGRSGAELSELLPELGTIADEIAIVRSVHTTQFNHAPGQIFMNTGSQVFGRPSLGSWLSYGLGSDSRDLPGFVVLLSGENAPDGGKSCWGSGCRAACPSSPTCGRNRRLCMRCTAPSLAGFRSRTIACWRVDSSSAASG